jgi:hypothetical protein
MTNWRSGSLGLGLLMWLGGCGGAPPAVTPADTPPASEPPAAPVTKTEPAAAKIAAANATPAAPEVPTTREVPSGCADKANCAMPSAFVDAVCKHKFPDLPLFLFAGRMPWKHLYVKAEYVEPVNPYGGEQSEAWLKFGEEVLVLRKKSNGGGKGVQISGPSDLDVLRWDGTCATIREEMLVTYVPAPMQSPRIIWRYLNADLQEALLKNSVVARSREAEKKACRDSSATHPTPVCEKAMQKLTDAIVLAVHQNVELPDSGSRPSWVK